MQPGSFSSLPEAPGAMALKPAGASLEFREPGASALAADFGKKGTLLLPNRGRNWSERRSGRQFSY